MLVLVVEDFRRTDEGSPHLLSFLAAHLTHRFFDGVTDEAVRRTPGRR